MANTLPSFRQFELQPRETAPVRFEKYIKKLKNYFLAMEVANPVRQRAMFLHYAGKETTDILDTLTEPAVDTSIAAHADVSKCTVQALKAHFEPQKFTDHLLYVFRKETQRPDELVPKFYSRLSIAFTDTEVEIKQTSIEAKVLLPLVIMQTLSFIPP